MTSHLPQGERRRYERRPASVPARLTLVGYTVEGRLEDVGAGGVRFTTDDPHKKETVAREEDECHLPMLYRIDIENVYLVRPWLLLVVVSDGFCQNRITQIGDDLQAKFDDKENLKYIDLRI